jgi:hypothetical protein
MLLPQVLSKQYTVLYTGGMEGLASQRARYARKFGDGSTSQKGL